jgi:nucleotide-binding universal stress UspA family protein
MVKYDKILFCTDFSRNAQGALPHAIDLAKKYGAALHVLHVYYDAGHIAEFEMSSDSKIEGGPLMVHMKGTEMGKRLEDVCGEVEEALGACKWSMARGKPSDAIVHYAKEEKIGLIVMSSHGLTGLEHALFGSTAERVVRYSPCDVLVVKSSVEE